MTYARALISSPYRSRSVSADNKLSAKIETTEEWKSQPAQIEIKRDSLISEVRKMIARSEDAI